MSAIHGKNTKFSFGGNDLSAYLDKSGISQDGDNAEVTTFGANSKAYVPGLKDGTIPLEGPFDAAVHAILAPLFNTEGAFVYQPNGTTVGQPKATGNAILSSYEITSEVGDVEKIKGELQITGDVTWGVN
jgi:hypothetical protein